MTDLDLPKVLDVARRATEAASQACLRYWRRDFAVDWKPDHSPVTQADKEAEAAAVQIIRDAFPDHALLTEETGAIGGGSENLWYVDPLDGTRGFTRAGFFWGPLIALEHRGEIVAGAMAIPALNESYWAARGMGAWRDGTRLRVSTVSSWDAATFSLGEMSRFLGGPAGPGVCRLIETCASARAFGDVAACAMLLNGRADAWIEGGVQRWDLAPMKVLVEEAGGLFTNFAGVPTIANGQAVATNGLLHPHVLAALARGGAGR